MTLRVEFAAEVAKLIDPSSRWFVFSFLRARVIWAPNLSVWAPNTWLKSSRTWPVPLPLRIRSPEL
jgi:hypothetical protein